MSELSDLNEEKYYSILARRIEVCKLYKPKFGQGKATTLEDFQTLYHSDLFYAWLGLDNPLIYAAHKTAGGITSLYRQIGTGCEELFREILVDKLGLSSNQILWNYSVKTGSNKERKLSLDARIQIADLTSDHIKEQFREWLSKAAKMSGFDEGMSNALKGAVFEVRQGYKSKDSKRQNADISNANTAIVQGYLPVVVILSNQIDFNVLDRYSKAGWLVLRGTLAGTTLTSTYHFCEQVLNYDLAAFFVKYSTKLKAKINEVLEVLLAPDNPPEISSELAILELEIEDNE
jgi:hypothetical protein